MQLEKQYQKDLPSNLKPVSYQWSATFFFEKRKRLSFTIFRHHFILINSWTSFQKFSITKMKLEILWKPWVKIWKKVFLVIIRSRVNNRDQNTLLAFADSKKPLVLVLLFLLLTPYFSRNNGIWQQRWFSSLHSVDNKCIVTKGLLSGLGDS